MTGLEEGEMKDFTAKKQQKLKERKNQQENVKMASEQGTSSNRFTGGLKTFRAGERNIRKAKLR